MTKEQMCLIELQAWVKSRPYYYKDLYYFTLDNKIIYIFNSGFIESIDENTFKFLGYDKIKEYVLEHILPILRKHKIERISFSGNIIGISNHPN